MGHISPVSLSLSRSLSLALSLCLYLSLSPSLSLHLFLSCHLSFVGYHVKHAGGNGHLTRTKVPKPLKQSTAEMYQGKAETALRCMLCGGIAMVKWHIHHCPHPGRIPAERVGFVGRRAPNSEMLKQNQCQDMSMGIPGSQNGGTVHCTI